MNYFDPYRNQHQRKISIINFINKLIDKSEFENKKTIFMHTPLFIESPDEVLAGIEEESLDIEIRLELLNLFDANGVDSGNVQN